MADHIFVKPGNKTEKNGGSYQECEIENDGSIQRYKKFCTIRDDEKAPATDKPGRLWVCLYRTPNNGESSSSESVRF